MRGWLALSLLISVVATGFAVLSYREVARLRGELALRSAVPVVQAPTVDLERLCDALLPRLREEDSKRKAARGDAVAGEVALTEEGEPLPPEVAARMIRQSVADLEQVSLRLDDLNTRVETAEATTQSFREQIQSGRLPSNETLEEVIKREMAARELKGGAGIDKKPLFDDFASVLALDDAQSVMAREALDAGKLKAYELLIVPRNDGGNFVDDLAAVFQEHGVEGGEERAGQVFMRLFSEPYPGTTETYGAKIIRLEQETKGSVRELLRPEQQTAFDELEVDYFEVKTGFDPFEEHIRKRLEGSR